MLIAPERAHRPDHFRVSNLQNLAEELCPFCEGNEKETLTEVLAFRSSASEENGPGWDVRIIPNKYPAVAISEEPQEQQASLFHASMGWGIHEIVVESPQHLTRMSDLSVKQCQQVLQSYCQRLSDLKHDSRIQYVQIFKNQGKAAGATLEHLHSQLIATSHIPAGVIEELERAKNYFLNSRQCFYCEMIQLELAAKSRLVMETDLFVAVTPFASRVPYEIWLVPRNHQSHFEQCSASQIEELAIVLNRVLKKLHQELNDVAFNYMIQSSPLHWKNLNSFHWHLQILPRLTGIGGYEWGTGSFINTVLPEDAAEKLRSKDVASGEEPEFM